MWKKGHGRYRRVYRIKDEREGKGKTNVGGILKQS